jgi:hypothetical protein
MIKIARSFQRFVPAPLLIQRMPLPTVPHISDRQSDPQLLKPFVRGFF